MSDDNIFGQNDDAFMADYWADIYKRRSFNGGEKNEIWRKGKGHCAYCLKKLRRKNAVFDHISPWRKGGPTTVENGAISCVSCNLRKGFNGDKYSPFDVAGLFFRLVCQKVQGPYYWGSYDKKNREVTRILRAKNGA